MISGTALRSFWRPASNDAVSRDVAKRSWQHPGTYPVALQVYNGDGFDSIRKSITVAAPPGGGSWWWVSPGSSEPRRQ